MSYQIKSTPYFQRMLTKSKKNGELQRLKYEYERIKEFNDNTIAMRIREVRLRRLYREIQDINASSAATSRAQRKVIKTYAQQRAEELSKARKLGTSFSRANASNVQRFGPLSNYSSMSILSRKARLQVKESSTAKRISYGNDISRHNMQKLKVANRRATEKADLRSVSSVEVDKLEKFRNRINYGNSCSSLNAGRSKHSSISKIKQTVEKKPSTGTIHKLELVKNYTFILEDDEIDDLKKAAKNSMKTNCIEDADDDEQKIETVWAELRGNMPLLKNTIVQKVTPSRYVTKRYAATSIRREQSEEPAQQQEQREQPEQDTQDVVDENFDSVPEENSEEYTLRKIDNDRNLPLSQFHYQVETTGMHEDESVVDLQDGETIIKVLNLSESEVEYRMVNNLDEQTKDDDEVMKPPKCEILRQKLNLSGKPMSQLHHPPNLKNKPLPTPHQQLEKPILLPNQVEDFVKLYEPFPRESEVIAPVKENMESGVAKLRSIFEHQGD